MAEGVTIDKACHAPNNFEMAQDTLDSLRARVRELEQEVEDREKDLAVFRRELSSANKRLESLIGDLNQELRVVYAIQKHLVPTEIPHIQGFDFSSKFVPSYTRGGDYYDVFDHEDRSRFGVIVASSSGHVMSALLLSVLLKFTGQLEARRGSEPHVMMGQIISEMLPSIAGKDSADLFYAVFDRRNFTLSYAKAGGVVALHYDYSANELKLLKSPTPVIGQGFSAEVTSQSIALNPRDKLIFCTKGVVEARNLEGQEFGQDRLYKAILEYATQGVHELRNQIFYQVQKYTSGQEPPRDMTVVVAEVKDRVIKLAKK
jgi:sigma-B regulation protein RsbU (phosphoserine phosphatase)